jgi:acetamidase/formamidase
MSSAMSTRIAILRSTPETVSWGWIAADRAPVSRVKSGQVVRIDTVTHQGLNTSQDPVAFFGAAGIPPGKVLADARDIYGSVKRDEGAGPHLLTGPVYVEGARPGDMLEVRVLKVAIRVPYGVNATGPGRGAVPDLLAQPAQRVIKLDLKRRVALFAKGVEVPLAPFMGIVAVAPPPPSKRVSTKPPGAFGGNLDFRHLVAGATLYLPVFNEGALLYTGDGHACQGDGEVDGTRSRSRHADPAAHRAQRRGQGHAMAARGGRCELLRNGHGVEHRRRAAKRDPRRGRVPEGQGGPVRGRRLRLVQPGGGFPDRRGRQRRADGLRRDSQAPLQARYWTLVPVGSK